MTDSAEGATDRATLAGRPGHPDPVAGNLRLAACGWPGGRGRLFVAVLCAALFMTFPAAAQQADAVTGVWLTDPGKTGKRARVEVRREGESFVGRIIWLEEPEFPSGARKGMPKTDIENPDEGLRDRAILGLEILSGMKHEGDGTWGGGTIYDPVNGKTYSASMSLDGPDDETLDLRGYIGISLFGRTTEWRRVK